MLDTNSTDSIFRFTQIRPTRSLASTSAIPLLNSSFARKLAKTTRTKCQAEAIDFLKAAGSIDQLLDTNENKKLVSLLQSLIAANAPVATLRQNITSGRREYLAMRKSVSDYLLASKFQRIGQGFAETSLDLLYKGFAILADDHTVADSALLSEVVKRPLLLPFEITDDAERPLHSAAAPNTHPTANQNLPDPQHIYAALTELTGLYRPELVNADLEDDHASTRPARDREPQLALNKKGLASLSAGSRSALEALDLDPAAMSVHAIAAALETTLSRLSTLPVTPRGVHILPRPPVVEGFPRIAAGVRVAGVADLLVVKQHLHKYRRTDIAHVENVLRGEKKVRTHRQFDRQEQTFVSEVETTHEKITELQTAERFELNQETQQTIKRDQQVGFNLSLSGKYGPTVEFSSQAEAEIENSREETTRSALNYAKDIMQRSLDRVVESVREQRVQRIIREQEETNLHEIANETGDHVTGIYQFLEKVMTSQVFNYGIRTMFDFMVPEPASYIWHLESTPAADVELPPPPAALKTYLPGPTHVTPYNYASVAAIFGARGIEPPPPTFKTAVAAVNHGETGDEEGKPRSVVEKEIAVPEGYRPVSAVVRAMALTDNELTLGITLGSASVIWRPSGGRVTAVGGGHRLGAANIALSISAASYPYDAQSKLLLHVLAFESNAYSVVANVVFARSQETFSAWQIQTYDLIAQAALEQQLKYEQKVEDLKAKAAGAAANAAAQFGRAPSQNLKVVVAELKKHCTSILTKQRYETFGAVVDGDPPYFNFDNAARQGAFIRFFEQAFEWDQLQYVCYPYFWSRRETWSERFRRQDIDPTLLEFLQAGAARVVVPARPGFENAIIHYLETGEIWNGVSEPPRINSPLYVSIIDEIKERTGASQGELPVGASWETIVPTPLVAIRAEDDLPEWVRQDVQSWFWEEAESN
ncbi:hypothetical protein GJW-30_1_03154 [Variibacter gotjawalensis]|uniref:Uncharacterized protein n=1 Tax=Variibacter gotjawalensis TaxID=1333996 RepID=A0A0S3PXG8_9BRAD|nr:hypothetical protein [Variibacter gotjawalensis]NIK46436.1 hypothetical protein [Variibacter gotjawalensis]RZS48346.1 hypothetical protein EV661_0756 [Variibacter gotjawalensis]BAT60606.1 hypothetical protein GJW-30_1_03154 [Variibacter gotjawalensis]